MCLFTNDAAVNDVTTLVGYVVSEYLHSMLYQSNPENLADGPNAMVLLIDAVGKVTMVKTSNFASVVDDMADALWAEPMPKGFKMARSLSMGPAVTFEHVGIYDVVLASAAATVEELEAVLTQQVSPNKRPSFKANLLKYLQAEHPTKTLLIACFDSGDKAEPLMAYWEPRDPNYLVLPALDGHTGDKPDFDHNVDVNHRLIVGSYQLPPDQGEWVNYTDDIPDQVRQFLPTSVKGVEFEGEMPNGDFRIPVGQILNKRPLTIFDFQRVS